MNNNQDKPQRIIRRVETCEACGAVGKFRIYATARSCGNPVSYAKCRVCGRRAVIRFVVKGA